MPATNDRRDLAFLLLAALFVATLVVCNLVASKFVAFDLGSKRFVLSAGVLAYPLTFLITDLLSEIYGRKRANQVVLSGLFASPFVLGIVWLGSLFPAIDGSVVSDAAYSSVFGSSGRVIFASMVAYLTAQLIDIRIYHFWREFTDGRHLWLRNNASTILSQLVDTVLVVCVLFVGEWTVGEIGKTIVDGWTFKLLVALMDTPLLYVAVYLFRRYVTVDES